MVLHFILEHGKDFFLDETEHQYLKKIINNKKIIDEIIISVQGFTKKNHSPHYYYSHAKKTSINFKEIEKKQHPIAKNNLKKIDKLHDIRNKIRQGMVGDKLIAYVINKEGKINQIEPYRWTNDENWHRLVVCHSIFLTDTQVICENGDTGWIQGHRGKIIFKENDLDVFIASQQNTSLSEDETLVQILLKGVKEGNIKLRATERLYIKSKIQFSNEEFQKEYNQHSANKGYLYQKIKEIAKSSGIQIIKEARSMKKNGMEPEQLNQGYTTEQEMEDVAKIIRPLYEQR